MGAWIEISLFSAKLPQTLESHPTMGAWIEICIIMARMVHIVSHPTMGAWIEIFNFCKSCINTINSVAPHDGCVD